MEQDVARTDIARTMQGYADDAVALARRHFSIELDYSSESISVLERLADTLCNNRPVDLDAERLNEMAFVLGGYLGEVMRREVGGTWEIIEHQGSRNLALRMKDDSHIFPSNRVMNRLMNGPDENIYHYFLFIRRDLDSLP